VSVNCPDEALGHCVRPWCPHRCLDDPDVDGGEDGVEGGGELAVSVSDEEPEVVVAVLEVHQQVAGEFGEPGSGRMGGDAEDVHPTAGALDDEERVGPVPGDGVEVEQVAGEDRLGLYFEELRPGRSGPSRRGVDSGGVQDGPDGGGADPDAEADEFAVDGESAWGAVAGFPRLRFPRPLSESDVRLSPHPALHRTHAAGSMFSVGQADGIVVPLQR